MKAGSEPSRSKDDGVGLWSVPSSVVHGLSSVFSNKKHRCLQPPQGTALHFEVFRLIGGVKIGVSVCVINDNDPAGFNPALRMF